MPVDISTSAAQHNKGFFLKEKKRGKCNNLWYEPCGNFGYCRYIKIPRIVFVCLFYLGIFEANEMKCYILASRWNFVRKEWKESGPSGFKLPLDSYRESWNQILNQFDSSMWVVHLFFFYHIFFHKYLLVLNTMHQHFVYGLGGEFTLNW